jgi:hypothetical protein
VWSGLHSWVGVAHDSIGSACGTEPSRACRARSHGGPSCVRVGYGAEASAGAPGSVGKVGLDELLGPGDSAR